MDLFDLRGKVAVVTGASSGLGIQFAKVLAKEGVDLAIVARRIEKLTELKSELEAYGVRCLPVKCDVTNTAEIKNAVETIKRHYKKIDILINNAGTGSNQPAEKQTDEFWNNMMATTLSGAFFFAREVGNVMIENNYGRIINVCSMHSVVALAARPLTAYCSAKGGLLMFTKALAVEWAKYNITVNAIGPSYFPSKMTESIMSDEKFLQSVKTNCPMGRTGRLEELDGAIIYFASDASSYTTGQLLVIDGGWTCI